MGKYSVMINVHSELCFTFDQYNQEECNHHSITQDIACQPVKSCTIGQKLSFRLQWGMIFKPWQPVNQLNIAYNALLQVKVDQNEIRNGKLGRTHRRIGGLLLR